MFAIFGALAIGLAAMTLLAGVVLMRNPAVPAALKGDIVAAGLALLFTMVLATGATTIVMTAQQTEAWQFAVAAAIVAGSLALYIAVYRYFAPRWRVEPPAAPVVDFPAQKKSRRQPAPRRQTARRRAA